MERAQAIPHASKDAPLADDALTLARGVAIWAAERPIVAHVTLFGERICAGYRNDAAVQIAVAYDEKRMVEGFDDWIEQLRTDFAELSTRVGQKVSVLTPESGVDWEIVYRSTKLPALPQSKVYWCKVIIPLPASEPDGQLRPKFGLDFLKCWIPSASEPLPLSQLSS